jgi:hypothetical protein
VRADAPGVTGPGEEHRQDPARHRPALRVDPDR